MPSDDKYWLQIPEEPVNIKGLRKMPSTKRGRATLERIAEVTRAILQEIGRDGFTLEQVIRRAHIPTGTIYQLFDGKSGLLDYVWPSRQDTYLPTDYTPPELHLAVQRLKRAPATTRSRATFDQLVEAGVHILQVTGRDEFTIRALVNRAGVSDGAFCRYFGNRTGLLDYLWADRRDTHLRPGADT